MHTAFPKENILSEDDLADWIYFSVGTLTMEDVRELLDTVKTFYKVEESSS